MEKWSEARINAYKRYIENDEIEIERWEWSLQEHMEGVKRAESMIESHRESLAKSLEELAKQGVHL